MQNTDTLFDEIRNVGYIDRAIRIIAGSAAIIFVMATQSVGMLGWMALIPLLAVYPIITGLIGYDSFYAWAQIDTSKSSVFSDANVMKLINNISDQHSAEPALNTGAGVQKIGGQSEHKNAA